MQDTEQFLEACAQRYHQAISGDYFIYHAFQYEFCLNAENRKQFVVVDTWLGQQDDSTRDFHAALCTMCDWYGANYSAFRDTQPLTFARCYFYLPVALIFVHEARALWEKLHGTPPPVYDAQHDFWRELLAVVRDKCQHQHLLLAWLHWRYGERPASTIAAENLPPNPFVERRTFGARRDGRGRDGGARRDGRGRDGGTRRDGGARREGAEHRAGGRGTDRTPPRGAVTRRDDRPRERGRATTSREQPTLHHDRPRERGHAVDSRSPARRERSDSLVVTELTETMTSEIEAAIAIMQGDNAHQGVTLQPANSYYRRLQHKMVSNLGFTSISVGDDRESRAVKIVRDA